MIHTSASQRLRLALRRGATSLGETAAGSVRDFLRSQFNPEGGFRGRSPASDLYYTIFGLECARALELELPRTAVCAYLRQQAARPVDFVHFTCLARAIEILGLAADPALAAWMAQGKPRLAAHLCPAGGFHRVPEKERGTVYDSFLGMLACEALGEPFPNPDSMLDCLNSWRKSSGGFGNEAGFGAPTTPVTAAALGLYWELRQPVPSQALDWLAAREADGGGFTAATLVPLPDLLSTATALHALNPHQRIERSRLNPNLDFVSSLWRENGGFCGHALDRRADCEYTFYGLLALGNLVTELSS